MGDCRLGFKADTIGHMRAYSVLVVGLIVLIVVGSLMLLSRPQQSQAAATYRVRLPVVARNSAGGSTGAFTPYYDGQFGYGVNTATNANALVAGMGFGYVKLYVSWATFEPQKGAYLWLRSPGADSMKQIVDDAIAKRLRVIIRVDNPPSWAAPGSGNRPPNNPADLGDFMAAYAQHMKGRVAAYEIWNEPNLAWEWGNSAPSPERYTQLLQAVYPKIKAADPQALVISAGLASTGGDGGATVLNDVEFIERMYIAGARGYFDALGSHPYGFANSPETRNSNNVTDFQRARDQRSVMERYGDGAKKVWATEMGWILDPAHYGHPEYLSDPLWAGRQWQRVDPQTQANYLVRAFQYAYTNWPWMAAMLVFDLDFSTVGYYAPAEPMRWYAILNQDFTPRPAYSALKAMAKPVGR
jgi:hypothetical protein